jgi:putative tricarboxylic transport membrane protein
MDLIAHLQLAFQVCLEPTNLFAAFIGCLVGTLVGVLPGLGPSAVIAMLLPLTYGFSPMTSIIMLSGIYYGAQYGGSTTSILVNIPGEASSIVTCLDGYQMAKKGRAGAALGISAIGSFVGGTFAIVILMLLAPPLANFALKFGPPESFAVIFFGMTMVIYLAQGSMLKSLIMAGFGMILGCVGTDLVTGRIRYSLGFSELTDGVGIVPACMGLFGIAEVLNTIEEGFEKKKEVYKTGLRELLPSKQELRDSVKPIVRASMLGGFLGLFPGGGPLPSSFMSYAMEKRLSKHPERFGTGEIAGVAGPETANNAACGGGFIPLFTLGIPTTPVLAILFGGLMIQGVTPGPDFIQNQPALFWGVVGSMYIGNFMLIVLNLPLVGLWVKLLRVPYTLLMPLILLFCLVGSYTLSNSAMDVYIMVVFGVIGYLMNKADYPLAPFILALILTPQFEKYLNQSLLISEGSPEIFFSRPISAVLLTISIALLVIPPLLKSIRRGLKLKLESGEP